jgi:flagellar hook-associated protein FlgK
MTPEEFAAKIEELRAVIADKITELEENPGWGSEEARQEVIQALDELVVQAQALSEVLQQQDDDVELDGEEG